MAELTVVIVNWNVRDLLDKCLASLQKARGGISDGGVEIIVVDCDSRDGSVAMVREKYPSVIMLAQDENIGFSRGSNLGMAAASGRFIMLLNPDTEVSENALSTMAEYLRLHPDVGIVGPRTLNTDGSHQSTRRRFPTLFTGIFESAWLSCMAPASVMERYTMGEVDDRDIVEVDWAQGSALMLRREVYDDIGGLDEGFFMYFEEMDYCKRAKNAGWKAVYHGGAVITHHGGKSSEQAAGFKQIQFHRSKLRYFRLHHGRASYLTLRVILAALFWWQLGLESLKALLGHKRELRRQRIKTYWRILRGGMEAEH